MELLHHDILNNLFTLKRYLFNIKIDHSFITFIENNNIDINYICFIPNIQHNVHYLLTSKISPSGYKLISIEFHNEEKENIAYQNYIQYENIAIKIIAHESIDKIYKNFFKFKPTPAYMNYLYDMDDEMCHFNIDEMCKFNKGLINLNSPYDSITNLSDIHTIVFRPGDNLNMLSLNFPNLHTVCIDDNPIYANDIPDHVKKIYFENSYIGALEIGMFPEKLECIEVFIRTF
jgi:hypothetical protein